MSNRRVGLWLIGSFGGVASTAALGLSALGRGLTDATSMVTALPLFGDLDLDPPAAFVVGGHEIRKGGFRQTVREFQERANVFDRDLTDACSPDLEKWEANVRPGVALNAGPAILRLADWPESLRADTPRRRRRTSPGRFARLQGGESSRSGRRRQRHLDGSPVRDGRGPFLAGEAGRGAGPQGAGAAGQRDLRLGRARPRLAVHQLHAVAGRLVPGRRAAGASCAATVYGGKDGKTGETLLKTVLAPMFALRNWRILSWVGHNIFGNRDGVVLDDPANKASKIRTKDQVISKHRRLQAANARLHRVHPVAGRLEDGLEPHPFPGLSRRQDDYAVHLAGLRFDPGGAAGARPGPAGAAGPAPRRARRPAAPGLLLQEPDGRAGTRLLQAVRACWRLTSTRRPASGGRQPPDSSRGRRQDAKSGG